MPQRSAIATLPNEVRKELDARLVKDGFSGYAALSAWLGENGFVISKSAVHRYGQEFEDRLAGLRQATEQTLIISESLGMEEGDMMGATITTAITNLQMANLKLQADPAPKVVAMLSKATAELVRAFGGMRRIKTDIREQVGKEERQKAAKVAVAAVKKAGISEEARRKIEEDILGLKR